MHLHHLAPISVDLQLLVPRTRGVAQVACGAPVLRRQAPPRERDLLWRQAVVPAVLCVVQRARRPYLVPSEQRPPLLVLAKQLHFFVSFSGQVAAAKRSSVVCFACFGSCGAATTAACANLA